MNFYLDQSGNPCIAGKDAQGKVTYQACGDMSKQGGSYDAYAAAIGQATTTAIKQGIPPCKNVVYGWSDCGNCPAKYYSPTIGPLVDVSAWKAAIDALCPKYPVCGS